MKDSCIYLKSGKFNKLENSFLDVNNIHTDEKSVTTTFYLINSVSAALFILN